MPPPHGTPRKAARAEGSWLMAAKTHVMGDNRKKTLMKR